MIKKLIFFFIKLLVIFFVLMVLLVKLAGCALDKFIDYTSGEGTGSGEGLAEGLEGILNSNTIDLSKVQDYLSNLGIEINGEDIEKKVVDILYKYCDKEEIDELVNNIKSNVAEGQVTIPEYTEELLNKVLNVIENPNITTYDKNVLTSFIEGTDLSSINNDQLISRIQELNINGNN